MKTRITLAAFAALTAVAAMATPALAEPPWERRQERRGDRDWDRHRGHDEREQWRGHYGPRPGYYAPPPVYYAPRPYYPPPGVYIPFR